MRRLRKNNQSSLTSTPEYNPVSVPALEPTQESSTIQTSSAPILEFVLVHESAQNSISASEPAPVSASAPESAHFPYLSQEPALALEFNPVLEFGHKSTPSPEFSKESASVPEITIKPVTVSTV